MLNALDTLSVPEARPEAQKEGPSASIQLPSVDFRREGASDPLLGEGLGTAEWSKIERREKIKAASAENTTNVDILNILGERRIQSFLYAKSES